MNNGALFYFFPRIVNYKNSTIFDVIWNESNFTGDKLHFVDRLYFIFLKSGIIS